MSDWCSKIDHSPPGSITSSRIATVVSNQCIIQTRRVKRCAFVTLCGLVLTQCGSAFAGPIIALKPPPIAWVILGDTTHRGSKILGIDSKYGAMITQQEDDDKSGIKRATLLKERYDENPGGQVNSPDQLGNKLAFHDYGPPYGFKLALFGPQEATDGLEMLNPRKAAMSIIGVAKDVGTKFEGKVTVGSNVFTFNVTVQAEDTVDKILDKMIAELKIPAGLGLTIHKDAENESLLFEFPEGTPIGAVEGRNVNLWLDNTAPEPQTIVLAGIGLAGLLIAGRRRLNRVAHSAA